MLRSMLRSKIHRATVTGKSLNYEGSITIDSTLLAAAGILPNEQVQVLNLSNGNRFETYAIPGQPGSGAVELNGPAARLGEIGDQVIIVTYALLDQAELHKHQSRVVRVDAQNRLAD